MDLVGSVFRVDWKRNARKPRWFWLRTAYAALLAVALVDVLVPPLAADGLALPATRVPALAAQLFWILAFVQLLAVLLLTPALAAGTIAADRERGALEPLLASDLGAADIVLGKLGARLWLLVGVLSPGLPALALAVWLGGVPAGRLLGVVGLTAVMLLATAGLSAWVSVHARGARDAVQVVYVTGVVVGLFPPLFALSPIPWPGGPVGTVLHQIDAWLVRPNPVFWLVRAWRTGAPDWQDWLVVMAANGALAVLCLVLAVVQVRRAAPRPGGPVARRMLFGLPWRRPCPWRWAVAWKELWTDAPVAGLERLARWVVSFIGWGALVWTAWALAASPFWPAEGVRTPFRVFALLVEPPLVCIGLLLVLARAATAVSAERERATWDSLLVAPVRPVEVIGAKMLGALLAARRVWLLLGLLWVTGVASGQLWPPALAVAAGVVIAVAVCAAAVGLLLSLWMKNSPRALTVAAVVTVLLSGGYLLCALPLLAPAMAGGDPPFWLLSPCVPFLAVAPMALAVGGQANPPALLATCGLGASLYASTSLVVVMLTHRAFDRWAGRSYLRPARRPTPTGAPPAPEPP
jgi:ABC-type Na+ efflux pump permease subunit